MQNLTITQICEMLTAVNDRNTAMNEAASRYFVDPSHGSLVMLMNRAQLLAGELGAFTTSLALLNLEITAAICSKVALSHMPAVGESQ